MDFQDTYNSEINDINDINEINEINNMTVNNIHNVDKLNTRKTLDGMKNTTFKLLLALILIGLYFFAIQANAFYESRGIPVPLNNMLVEEYMYSEDEETYEYITTNVLIKMVEDSIIRAKNKKIIQDNSIINFTQAKFQDPKTEEILDNNKLKYISETLMMLLETNGEGTENIQIENLGFGISYVSTDSYNSRLVGEDRVRQKFDYTLSIDELKSEDDRYKFYEVNFTTKNTENNENQVYTMYYKLEKDGISYALLYVE